MTERWVKATIAGHEQWVNMAKGVRIESTKDGSWVGLESVGDFAAEPPRHFLPPRDYALQMAMGFLRAVAAGTQFDGQMGPELKAYAQRILKEIEG